jgi:hypothetical protein
MGGAEVELRCGEDVTNVARGHSFSGSVSLSWRLQPPTLIQLPLLLARIHHVQSSGASSTQYSFAMPSSSLSTTAIANRKLLLDAVSYKANASEYTATAITEKHNNQNRP